MARQFRDLDLLILESNYDPHLLHTGTYPYFLKQRVAGAYVVTVDGEPTLYVERSRKGVLTLPGFDTRAEPAIAALRTLAENSSRRELALERLDGDNILTSTHRALFEEAGFVREYLGLTLRLPALQHPRARTA